MPRVSKIYHMGVPGGIEQGGHGADDAASWHERYNSKARSGARRARRNAAACANGKRPVVGGNTFVVVEADGDDLVHSDGKTAKAAELIGSCEAGQTVFSLVGFVRPRAAGAQKYYEPFLLFENETAAQDRGDWVTSTSRASITAPA